MKLVPETNYKIVNDDGSDVRPAIEQKVKDIVQLMKDSKILGDGSPVANSVAMKVASAILTRYELRKKRPSNEVKEQVAEGLVPKDEDTDNILADVKTASDEENARQILNFDIDCAADKEQEYLSRGI